MFPFLPLPLQNPYNPSAPWCHLVVFFHLHLRDLNPLSHWKPRQHEVKRFKFLKKQRVASRDGRILVPRHISEWIVYL